MSDVTELKQAERELAVIRLELAHAAGWRSSVR